MHNNRTKLYPIENKVNNGKCITAVIGSLGYITISNHPLPGLVHIFLFTTIRTLSLNK